jgi:hypothetical protein
MTNDDFKVTDKRGQSSTEAPKSEADQNRQSVSETGFTNLIISLGTSAMIHMGVIDNPVTKKKEKDLNMAKQEIDLIMMLKEKTVNNLTEAEKKAITQVLSELQTRFVEANKSS